MYLKKKLLRHWKFWFRVFSVLQQCWDVLQDSWIIFNLASSSDRVTSDLIISLDTFTTFSHFSFFFPFSRAMSSESAGGDIITFWLPKCARGFMNSFISFSPSCPFIGRVVTRKLLDLRVRWHSCLHFFSLRSRSHMVFGPIWFLRSGFERADAGSESLDAGFYGVWMEVSQFGRFYSVWEGKLAPSFRPYDGRTC